MRILMSAYACAPHMGSEGGVGWGWATAFAEIGHEVCVLTRASNRSAIERALAGSPRQGLRFVYHDLPAWALAGKRLAGGVGLRPYYLAWQASARPLLRRLVAAGDFDMAHHATFAQYWSGSPLAGLGLPLLLGPVGGGEACPPAFWPGCGPFGAGYEGLRAAVPLVAPLLPALRRTVRTARLAIASTPETAERLVRLGARKVEVISQAALDGRTLFALAALPVPASAAPVRFLFLGELLPHKGCHLALRALAAVEGDWLLDVVGGGPERRRLERLTARLGLADRVRFHGRLPRPAALARLGAAHVLLFPALHDSAGLAVAEAMVAGLPTICLALGGPATLVTPASGAVVAATTPAAAVAGLAAAAREMLLHPERRARLPAPQRAAAMRRFSFRAKAEAILAAWAAA